MEISKLLNILLYQISFFKFLWKIDDNYGLQGEKYDYIGFEFNHKLKPYPGKLDWLL